MYDHDDYDDCEDYSTGKPIWRKALKLIAITLGSAMAAFVINVAEPDLASKARFAYLHAVAWVCNTVGVDMPADLSDELAEEPIPDDIDEPHYFNSIEVVEAKYGIHLLKPTWLPDNMELSEVKAYWPDYDFLSAIHYKYSSELYTLYYSVDLYKQCDVPPMRVSDGCSKLTIGDITYTLSVHADPYCILAETYIRNIYYMIVSTMPFDTLAEVLNSHECG